MPANITEMLILCETFANLVVGRCSALPPAGATTWGYSIDSARTGWLPTGVGGRSIKSASPFSFSIHIHFIFQQPSRECTQLLSRF
jgi:hypothetical protein